MEEVRDETSCGNGDSGGADRLGARDAVGLETPDEVVREYLQGVAQGDVERVLETTAVDEMADGCRFEQMADRLGTLLINMPGPVHSPFVADIQGAEWTAELLGQTRMLVYSVARSPFEGDPCLVGFTLLRYGDEWKSDDSSLRSAVPRSRLRYLGRVGDRAENRHERRLMSGRRRPDGGL